MNFAAASGLWLALIAIPVIVLYVLKIKRHRRIAAQPCKREVAGPSGPTKIATKGCILGIQRINNRKLREQRSQRLSVRGGS